MIHPNLPSPVTRALISSIEQAEEDVRPLLERVHQIRVEARKNGQKLGHSASDGNGFSAHDIDDIRTGFGLFVVHLCREIKAQRIETPDELPALLAAAQLRLKQDAEEDLEGISDKTSVRAESRVGEFADYRIMIDGLANALGIGAQTREACRELGANTLSTENGRGAA